MASSGSFTTSSYKNLSLKVSWSIISQSIEDNTSTISWSLKGHRTDGSEGYVICGGFKVVINGNTVYSKSTDYRIKVYNGTVVASGELTISHDSNGAKSFTALAEAGIYYYEVNCNGAGSFTLDTIPRKSTLSVANGTLGVSQKLTITRKSTNFTHTVTYKCGRTSGTIFTKSSSTSISWMPPLSLAGQNTTGSSVSVALTITTYNGNTSIGSETKTITCAIPDSVMPTASLALSDPTGHKSTYGGYVQNQSQITVKISGSGAYGSTIKSYQIKVGDSIYSGDSVTVDLPESGDLTIEGTVTDSRARTGSGSEKVIVLKYKMPKVSKLAVERRADDDGFVQATFSASVTSLDNLNSASYKIQYRKEGSTQWESLPVDAAEGEYAPSNVAATFAAAEDSAFEIRVAASDDFGTVYSSIRTVTLAFALLQTDTTGTGLSVGQRAVDPNAFAVGIPTQLNAGISKVAVDKQASSREALGIGKQLWVAGNGSLWSSDNPTLTIEELPNYTMFYVGLEGHATNILVIRDGNYFRGVGAYDQGDAQQIYTINAMITGTTLTLESLLYAKHFYGGSVGEAVAVEANCIYGIF